MQVCKTEPGRVRRRCPHWLPWPASSLLVRGSGCICTLQCVHATSIWAAIAHPHVLYVTFIVYSYSTVCYVPALPAPGLHRPDILQTLHILLPLFTAHIVTSQTMLPCTWPRGWNKLSFNGYNCSFETKLVYKLISCFLPFRRAVFSLDACKDASGGGGGGGIGGGGNPLFQPSSYTTKNNFLQVFTYSRDKKVSLQG